MDIQLISRFSVATIAIIVILDYYSVLSLIVIDHFKLIFVNRHNIMSNALMFAFQNELVA